MDLSPAPRWQQGPEACSSQMTWVTLEAAGSVLAEGLEKWAKGGRQGLRRLGGAASATRPPLTWLSWASAGSIRQYSGACLQPIPPRGLLSCSLRRDWAARRLPGSCAVLQGLGGLPSAPLPSPRAPRCFPGLLGAPWCWIPTNLGLLEVSIPVCSVAFPPFLSYFQGLYHSQPCIHVNHPPIPNSDSPANTAAA